MPSKLIRLLRFAPLASVPLVVFRGVSRAAEPPAISTAAVSASTAAVSAPAVSTAAAVSASTSIASASGVGVSTVTYGLTEAKEIVFPPPPEIPRIKYLRSIGKESDLGGKGTGFWSRLVQFLTGRKNEGLGLARPSGIAVLGQTIYVADSDAASIVIFDQETRKARRIGGGPERLLVPIGVAVDASSRVFVTDSVQNAVQAYGPDGNLLWQAGGMETKSVFRKPTGIALAPNGELVVADTGNARIVVLSREGKVLRSFGKKGGGDGELSVPTNVWVQGDGTILVSDSILCRIQGFSPKGDFLFKFGQQGDMAGYFSRPKGVSVDSDGNIHVVDQLFNAVQIFDRKGELLLFYGSDSGAASLELPAGVFIDAQDRIYVADAWNRRVQIFQYLKQAPPPASAAPKAAGR